jgi:hypothetical protein
MKKHSDGYLDLIRNGRVESTELIEYTLELYNARKLREVLRDGVNQRIEELKSVQEGHWFKPEAEELMVGYEELLKKMKTGKRFTHAGVIIPAADED